MLKTFELRQFLLIILLSVSVVPVFSQQEPHFTHNMFNNMAINPGSAGSNDAICATGLVRQQWVGFKDPDGNKVAPETYLFSINSPIRLVHGGVGLTFVQDKLGFSKDMNLKIAYAYRFDFGMGKMGIGLDIGFVNKSADFSKYEPLEEDPLLDKLSGEQSDMLIDLGFGAFYMVPNKYYLGLSTVQLMEGKGKTLAEYVSPDVNGSLALRYNLKRHYYLAGGYEFPWPGNPLFEIDPSVLVKTDGVKTEYSLAALLKYNDRVWGGLNYSTLRVMDPLAVMLGLHFKDFRVGYSYGIPTSAIGSSGSHEVMVNYCFKIEIDKGRRSYRNTRFL